MSQETKAGLNLEELKQERAAHLSFLNQTEKKVREGIEAATDPRVRANREEVLKKILQDRKSSLEDNKEFFQKLESL